MNPPKTENILEYKLRVPKNLVKNYYVMKLNSPRPVNFNDVNNAYLSRKNPLDNEEDRSENPSTGAGSQFGKDKKEESKRRRRGAPPKEINSEDMLYSLQLCGKKDKRFHGKKEGTILDNSSYYILTQCPDGVFEAMPIQAWYNFKSSINYHVLSSDDVEKEFSKRDKTINFHNMMVQKRLKAIEEKEEDQIIGEKVRQTFRDDLMIHDDEEDDEDFSEEDSDDNEKKPKKTKTKTKKKDKYGSKKKKKNDNDDDDDVDSDEEEELDNAESKEFDYMSESSSTDEEKGLQDEPEPEAKGKVKAKDDLNVFLSDSDSEESEEELTTVGKELKEILKREAGDEGSSLDEEDEDEDIDDNEKYSKSALFMPGNDGKKKKSGRSGSVSGSNSSSRSATPTQLGDTNRPGTPQSGKKSSKDAQQRKQASNRNTPTLTPPSNKQDYQSSRKRPSSRQSPEGKSPPSKKEKLQSINQDKNISKKQSLDVVNTQKSLQKEPMDAKEPLAITEVTIRRYLSHKPMTTTDLVKKFKTKRTGLTKEQTVSTIAAILKKIGPERQTIDGKLYLSLKPKK